MRVWRDMYCRRNVIMVRMKRANLNMPVVLSWVRGWFSLGSKLGCVPFFSLKVIHIYFGLHKFTKSSFSNLDSSTRSPSLDSWFIQYTADTKQVELNEAGVWVWMRLWNYFRRLSHTQTHAIPSSSVLRISDAVPQAKGGGSKAQHILRNSMFEFSLPMVSCIRYILMFQKYNRWTDPPGCFSLLVPQWTSEKLLMSFFIYPVFSPQR